MDENNKIKKSKYEVIDHYNHYSKGVDRLNQYCQYYRTEHKEVRWWRTLFTQVLEIILYNDFVHAKILKLTSEYKQFCLMFIEYICNFEDRSQIPKPVKLAETHFPSKVSGDYSKPCKLCYLYKRKIMCGGCKVQFGKEITLYPGLCWAKFHDNPAYHFNNRKKAKKQAQNRQNVMQIDVDSHEISP